MQRVENRVLKAIWQAAGLRDFGSVPLGTETCAARPFDHHEKEDAALVPTANPAHAPAIDAVIQGGWLGEPQEPSLNFHSHPCMARLGGTVKAAMQLQTAVRISLATSWRKHLNLNSLQSSPYAAPKM
jgi:hypothetical protein